MSGQTKICKIDVFNSLSGLSIITLAPDEQMNVVQKIEELYEIYKHTLPSKGTNSKRFKALNLEDIPDGKLILHISRKEAKDALLTYVKEHAKEIEFKGWFWQSKVDPDLVILKEWYL